LYDGKYRRQCFCFIYRTNLSNLKNKLGDGVEEGLFYLQNKYFILEKHRIYLTLTNGKRKPCLSSEPRKSLLCTYIMTVAYYNGLNLNFDKHQGIYQMVSVITFRLEYNTYSSSNRILNHIDTCPETYEENNNYMWPKLI